MAIDYTVFTNIFIDLWIFNRPWILNIILSIITLTALSRDTNTWKEIALPIMLGWDIAGIKGHIIPFVIGAFYYIIALNSTKLLGNLISIYKTRTIDTQTQTIKGETKEIKKRLFEGGHLTKTSKITNLIAQPPKTPKKQFKTIEELQAEIRKLSNIKK